MWPDQLFQRDDQYWCMTPDHPPLILIAYPEHSVKNSVTVFSQVAYIHIIEFNLYHFKQSLENDSSLSVTYLYISCL